MAEVGAEIEVGAEVGLVQTDSLHGEFQVLKLNV